MPVSRLVTVWLPVVAWAVLIFAISSIPNLGTGLGGWDLVLRKAAHLTEYAVLGALLERALSSAAVSQRLATAWTLGTAYAATDELHQHFVSGRHASVVDLVIDSVGVAAGVAAVWLASPREHQLETERSR
jgi:VanZ family protein